MIEILRIPRPAPSTMAMYIIVVDGVPLLDRIYPNHAAAVRACMMVGHRIQVGQA